MLYKLLYYLYENYFLSRKVSLRANCVDIRTNLILAAEKATKDLQEALAEYYCELYKDSMFTYDTEEHRIDLSEIYVPIKWQTREKSTKGVTEKILKNYHEIFHKVIILISSFQVCNTLTIMKNNKKLVKIFSLLGYFHLAAVITIN